MSSFNFLTLQISASGVATVTLNRPDVHNALNDGFIAELTHAFTMLDLDPEVRFAVLKGAGKSFCAGADLQVMKDTKSASFEANQQKAVSLARMFETINQFSKPLLGVVHGAALGGGIGMVSVCDYVVASANAQFGLTEVRAEDFGGLLFVTLSDAAPSLDDFLGRIRPALRTALGGDGRLGLLGYQKVVYDTNWKAYVDNDGYHPPLLHRAFKMLNWQGGKGTQYATERGHVVIEAELTLPDNPGFLRDASLLEFRQAHRSKGSVAVVISPLTVITMHLDMINIRFAIPREVGKTEVHYGYFHHLDDDADMIRHRLRQAGNMLGPSGLVSIEDAAIFHRIQAGNRTPGNALFQKGVHDEHGLWFDFKQNDEAGNMPRWEWYRKALGFVRERA